MHRPIIGLLAGLLLLGSCDGRQRSSAPTSLDLSPTLEESGTIQGVKWYDANGDGGRDGDEAALAGWEIQLTGQDLSGTPLSLSTATDGTGVYQFTVPFGSYQVAEACPVGWAQSHPEPASGCGSGTWNDIAVGAGNEIVTGVDFGNFEAAVVTGRMWQDADADAFRDPGELPHVGWEVVLEPSGFSGGPGGNGEGDPGPVRSTRTDASGEYSFTVPYGTYVVREVCEAGWRQTFPSPSQGCGSGIWLDIPLSAGNDFVGDLDFGNTKAVSIGGRKWEDADRDGLPGADEAGIPNWSIHLQGTDAAGNPVNLSTNTDEAGNYQFEVPLGSYAVSESCPPGWRQSYPTPTDGCGSGAWEGIEVDASVVAVQDLDFGNYRIATISGRKWKDLDRDGVQDADEEWLGGWEIQLQGEDASGVPIGEATETAGDGSYSFTVPYGTYLVREVCTAHWMQSYPSPPGSCGSGVWQGVIADQGHDAVSDLDFGNYPTATLSGRVWEDQNRNGDKDGAESGLRGWQIQVEGVDAFGNPLSWTGRTGSGGYYSFEVPYGAYDVREECPSSSWIQTYPRPIDGCGSGGWNGIEVADGQNLLLYLHFGNYLPDPSLQLEKRTNGVDADTPGAAPTIPVGAVVEWAYQVTNTGNTPLTEVTVTDDQGVAVTCPTTTLAVGESMVCTGSGVATEGLYANVGTASGQPPDGIPAVQASDPSHYQGEGPQYSLSGHKYEDANADGQDTGDWEPLAGWRILLFDASGDLLHESTTDAQGRYEFQIGAGTWRICETLRDPATGDGWSLSYPQAGFDCSGLPGDLGPRGYEVSLPSPGLHDNLDFANWRSAKARGFKFRDIANDGDEDGNPDPGDVPLGGTSIWLFRSANGALSTVGSTTTAADGSYAFAGLRPGEYVTCEASRSTFRLSYPSDAENLVCSGEAGMEPHGYAFTVGSGGSGGLLNFFNAGEIFGCTPGYWKNHTDRWRGYQPSQSVGSVFGAAQAPFRSQSLEDALSFPGGNGLEGAKGILLRAAVASLTNFSSGEFIFEVPAYQTLESLTTAPAMITRVNEMLILEDPGSRDTILRLATQLDRANNAANGCPLGGTPATRGDRP